MIDFEAIIFDMDGVIIEDSINGVLSARRAGCMVAGLASSFSTEHLLEAGAHFAADNFETLATALFRESP